MKTTVLFLIVSVNCFSQQLHRQTFNGGVAASTNGISLMGEAFNKSSTSGTVHLHESILFQIAHFNTLSVEAIDTLGTELIIFPNPVADVLNFHHKEIELWNIVVFDTAGKIILSKEKAQGMIDLSVLATGQYYLTFRHENQIFYKKILKI